MPYIHAIIRAFAPRLFLLVSLLTLAASPPIAFGQSGANGTVELPLGVYNQLVETSRDPKAAPRSAPAGYALGTAKVTVTVDGGTPRPSAAVKVQLKIQVLENEWQLIPVLPAGTAVDSAKVGGSDVQLINSPEGLAWSMSRIGIYDMTLTYQVDVSSGGDAGLSLPLPLPRATSTTLTATLPGSGLDVAVIPSAGTRATASGDTTRVVATLPTTSGVQISWRAPNSEGHALSRARYTGQLVGEAIAWSGELTVELWHDETITLPLLPRTVTLSEVRVDGKEAAILVEGDAFATLVQGPGRHKVEIGFEVPVVREGGPPRIDLQVPEVPVSRFELTLPGKKEITVTPGGNVANRQRGDTTVATAHVPLTRQVSFSWAEAVPEEIRAEVRANAGLYHAVHAEEGVLFVRALVDYQISRGETNVLRFAVPPEVQVGRVESPSGAVADWRLSESGDGARELSVFLDRQLQGDLVLDIGYDRSLTTEPAATPAAGTPAAGTPAAGTPAGGDAEIKVPLLRALDSQRQRGMVVLLSSQDLALEPSENTEATRVGENQLPAFVRQALEMTVAHTFKYVETPPELIVRPTLPERQQGRFDARVDTLISLGEVTIRGSASLEIDVKSGRIMELTLGLPAGVNLLSLTGPSVRDHTTRSEDGEQIITVEFTQEMEGQFRLEAAYERILVDSEASLTVPTVGVRGAEVEQGRIAVEALSAVEVQPAAVEQLTSLDITELPRQLILRTTNPILMAYKYVHTDPPYKLDLQVTRHQTVEVQEAAIDRADYRTLMTRDGLAVTLARFMVRNSRKQFLRVKLPEGSKVWSAFVDGQPEKPAHTVTDSGEDWHLIKIIHSTRSFPVELIFQTPAGALSGLGTLRAVLPRPEILVTQSHWDVHLPAGVSYGRPKSSMELVAAGSSSPAELAAEMARLQDESGAQELEPLRLVVPTHAAGFHYAFEKIYANQSAGDVGFEIPYASGVGRSLGSGLSLLGALACWLGIGLLARFGRLRHRSIRHSQRLGIGLLIGGGALLAVMILRYQVDTGPVVWLSAIVACVVLLLLGRDQWEKRREQSD